MKRLINLINLNGNKLTKAHKHLLSVLLLTFFIIIAMGSDENGKSTKPQPKPAKDNTTVIISVIAGIALIGAIGYFVEKSGRTLRLKKEYEAALRGKNKKAALNAGRRYYAAAKMASFNAEQAINNDISAMDDA